MSQSISERPILIVGFHRSGTSAVARMFHAAGVDLGQKLLGSEPANPYGHFEDLEVVELHDTFLARAGKTWKSAGANGAPVAPEPFSEQSAAELRSLIDQRRASGVLWGAKDPRLCLYLDRWLGVVPDARVVVVVRRPDEAIRSLHMRHSRRHVETRGVDRSDLDFWREPDLALELWVHYHERLLSAIGAAREPHFVDFNDRKSLERLVPTIAARWDIDLSGTTLPSLDPHLGRSTGLTVEVRSTRLLAEATEVWSGLLARISKA